MHLCPGPFGTMALPCPATSGPELRALTLNAYRQTLKACEVWRPGR